MARIVKKVICEYCGQEVSASNYSKHLRRHQNHPETFGKTIYHLDHDDLFCKFCGKECKNKKSLVQHEIRCHKNASRINVKPSYGMKGKTAWNKGLTKETDERVKQSSETYHKNHELGLHNPSFNPMSVPEIRKKHKLSMKKAYSNYTRRTPGKFKYGYYKGVWCDSSWELAYLVYALEHGSNIIRNKEGFKYIWKGDYHTYFPDFYNPESNTYIEIKGYKSDRDIAKISQFKNKLILIEKTDIAPILDYVEDKYGKNFPESLYDKIEE